MYNISDVLLLAQLKIKFQPFLPFPSPESNFCYFCYLPVGAQRVVATKTTLFFRCGLYYKGQKHLVEKDIFFYL